MRAVTKDQIAEAVASWVRTKVQPALKAGEVTAVLDQLDDLMMDVNLTEPEWAALASHVVARTSIGIREDHARYMFIMAVSVAATSIAKTMREESLLAVIPVEGNA